MSKKNTGKREITYLPIEQIKLDPDNPRINFIHEKQENPDDPQIASELTDNSTKYNQLLKSILSFGGIHNPIVVSKTAENQYLCIEGNTRLSLFRDFAESTDKSTIEKNAQQWKEIPAIIFDSSEANELNKIRLQAHLVGPREWPKINKARYVYELMNNSIMSDDDIQSAVGGTMSALKELATGYKNYIDYFVPAVGGDSADTKIKNKFSGIVEYSKPSINTEVSAHLGEDHWTVFSKWLMEGKKWRTLSQIRKLPQIFLDDNAREEFLSEGGTVDSALKEIDDSGARSTDEIFDEYKDSVNDSIVRELADRLFVEIEDWTEEEWKRVQEEEVEVFESMNLLKTKLDKLYDHIADDNQD